MEPSKNVPSLDEAERVVSFVLSRELAQLAAKVADGAATADSLREFLALTIAIVGATESLYQASGKPNPSQWETLERSAHTFADHFVLKWLAENDPQLRREVTRHRRRKLTARAGTLCLVETDRDKQKRWSAVMLADDAAVPIAPEVGEGLAESLHDRSLSTSLRHQRALV